MKNKIFKWLYRLLKNKKGTATVEFVAYAAFFAPIIFAAILFEHDVVSKRMEIEEAARYAMYYITYYADEGSDVPNKMKTQLQTIVGSVDGKKNYKKLDTSRLNINVKTPRSYFDYYTVTVSYNYPLPPIFQGLRSEVPLSTSLSFYAGNRSIFNPDQSLNFFDIPTVFNDALSKK